MMLRLSLLLLFFLPSLAFGDSWLKVDIGIIGTSSADILETAQKRVVKDGHTGLFIVLDTPGGALDATRKMVKAMMASEYPVVVWVGPGGARAASAGAFITIAANVAIMAPGTNIGAATPIQASGQDIEQTDAKKKVENDTRSFIEAIASQRGRNKDMAVSFVVNALSVTAEEALENNVIDLIASSEMEALRAIDGREVELDSGDKQILATKTATFVVYEKSLRQELLEILSNPNLFYMLFLAGMLGIGFELTHPGVFVPGVLGLISMVLALIATSVLPVSFGAMVLMIAAVGFMVAEMFLPSFGILGIGGFIAFIVGSVLLVDPENQEGLRVSWYTIAPGSVFMAVVLAAVGWLVLRSERSKVKSGARGMIGREARVIEDFIDGKGTVRIDGEIWRAVTDPSVNRSEEVAKDSLVVISSMDGLTLNVTTDSSARVVLSEKH